MELTINSEVYFLENVTINEIINLIEIEKKKNDTILSHFIIEGEEYYNLEELSDHLNSAKIQIVLKASKELIIETLKSIQHYLDRALPEIEKLADDFYVNVNGDTWNKTSDMLEGLAWIYQVVYSVRSMNNHDIHLENSFSLMNDLKQSFTELEQGFKEQDALVIADLIQYEIKPVLEKLNLELHQILIEVSNDVN